MKKEHKKLYKAGKNWTVGTIITIASAVVITGQNTANADTVEDQPVQSQIVNDDQSNEVTENNDSKNLDQQIANAKSDVSDAQQNVNDVQKAVDGSQDLVNQTKQSLDESNKNVEGLQSEVNSQEQEVKRLSDATQDATPENIQLVKDQIKNDQNEISKQSDTVNSVTKEISDKQTIVDEFSKNVEQQQSEVDAFQNAKDQAKKTFDGTGMLDLVDKVENSQKVVSDAKSDVQKDQQQLDQAKNDQDISQQNVDKYAKQQNQAQTNIDSTQKQLDKSQQELISANADLINAKSDEELAKNKLNGLQLSDFILSSDYIKAINDAMSTYKEGHYDQQKLDAIKSVANPLYNKYVNDFSNERKIRNTDQKVAMIVGEQSLSEEDQYELSQYATALINSFNSQLGNQTLFNNSAESNKMANEYAQLAINEGREHQHVTGKGLTELNDKNHIFVGECLDSAQGIYTKGQKLTIGDLKNTLRESILTMLFADAGSNWGHEMILNTQRFVNYGREGSIGILPNQPVFLGLAIQSDGTLRFEAMYPDNNESPLVTNNHGTQPDLSNMIANAQSEENKAQEALTNAQNNYNVKKQAVSDLKNELNSAKTSLENATKELDKANKQLTIAKNAYSSVQDKLNEDQKKLSNVESKLEIDQASLDAYQQKQSEKLKAYNEASANVERAQAKLDKLTKQLNQANDDLNKARVNANEEKTKLENLKTKLVDDQKKLQELENGPVLLSQAQAELTDLNQQLTDAKDKQIQAQKDYDQAVSDLNNDENKLNEAKKSLNEAQAKLDELLSKVKDQETKDATDKDYHVNDDNKVVDNNGNPIEGWTVNENGQMTDPHGQVITTPQEEARQKTKEEQMQLNNHVNQRAETSSTINNLTSPSGHYVYNVETGQLDFVKNDITNNSQTVSSIEEMNYTSNTDNHVITLPQTGNKDTNEISVLELMTLALGGLFFGTARKREER